MKDIKRKIKGKHCTRHIIRLSEVHMKKWRMSDVGQIVTRSSSRRSVEGPEAEQAAYGPSQTNLLLLAINNGTRKEGESVGNNKSGSASAFVAPSFYEIPPPSVVGIIIEMNRQRVRAEDASRDDKRVKTTSTETDRQTSQSKKR